MKPKTFEETVTDLYTLETIRESLRNDDDMDKRTFERCLSLLSRYELMVLKQYRQENTQEVDSHVRQQDYSTIYQNCIRSME